MTAAAAVDAGEADFLVLCFLDADLGVDAFSSSTLYSLMLSSISLISSTAAFFPSLPLPLLLADDACNPMSSVVSSILLLDSNR